MMAGRCSILLFALVLSLVCSVSWAEGAAGGGGGLGEEDVTVENLDAKIYQSKVLDASSAWLVWFSKSASEEDENKQLAMLASIRLKVASYGINVGRVSCDNKANKKLCQTAIPQPRIPSFSFVFEAARYNPYTKKNHRAGIPFDGSEVSIRTIEKFLLKHYKPSPSISAFSSLDLFAANTSSSTRPTLVLLTERSAISMFYKSVAYAFSEQELFVSQVYSVSLDDIKEHFASISSTELASVKKLPILGLITTSADNTQKMVVYEGTDIIKERRQVLNWIEKTSNSALRPEPLAATKTSDGGDGESQKTSPKSAQEEAVRVKTAAELLDVETLGSKEAWIVAVQEEGGAKEKLGAEWDKLVNTCEGVIKPAILTCPTATSSSSPPETLGTALCARGVATPFFFVLPYGSNNRKRIASNPSKGSHLFTSETLGEVMKYAQDSLPEHSVSALTEESIEDFMKMGMEKKITSTIVLSNKPNPPIFLRNVALTHAEYTQIGFVFNPSDRFLSNIGNPKLPTVVSMTFVPDVGMQVQVFDEKYFGKITKFSSFQSFILSTYARSDYYKEKIETQSKQQTMSAIDGDVQTELLRVTSEAEWQEHCGSSFRGICAIGMSNGADDSATIGILRDIMTSLGKAGAAFKFLLVDGKCFQEFALRFDVSYDNLPAAVAYSPSKSRYANFKGNFLEAEVKDFFQAVLTGKASTQSIPQRPIIPASCDLVESEVIEEASAEADSDAESFLEEIRREEKEKAAALKKEMKEEAERKKLEEEAAKKKPKASKKKKKRKTKTASSEL